MYDYELNSFRRKEHESLKRKVRCAAKSNMRCTAPTSLPKVERVRYLPVFMGIIYFRHFRRSTLALCRGQKSFAGRQSSEHLCREPCPSPSIIPDLPSPDISSGHFYEYARFEIHI